jgi:hypothetical protein
MARRPNYNHERRERDRAKSAKRAARAEVKKQKANERKGILPEGEEPVSPDVEPTAGDTDTGDPTADDGSNSDDAKT